MAKSNTSGNDERAQRWADLQNGQALDYANVGDNYMVFSAKGYTFLLPMFEFPGLSEAEANAANAGLKHTAYTWTQQAVDAAKGTPAEIHEIVQHKLLAEWKPGETKLATTGALREKIARELFAAYWEGKGNANAAATVRAGNVVRDSSGADLLPRFMAARAAEIGEALAAELTAYEPPTPRGSGGKAAKETVVQDVADF